MRTLASAAGASRRNAVVGVLALLAGVTVLALWLGIDRLENARFREHERARLAEAVANKAMRLTETLAGRIFTVHALELLARLDPDFDAETFAHHAASIAAPDDVRALELAPGGIIRHAYPVAGNEAVLGIDLTSLPEQTTAVQRTVDAGDTVVAGPVALLQGGRGFLIRRPVFTNGGHYWGLAISVVDVDGLLAAAGWPWEDSGLLWALRGRDGAGAAGEVFVGDAGIFERAPVTAELSVPGGAWQLAAVPAAGWPLHRPRAAFFRIVGLTLAAAAAVAVWAILRLIQARDEREAHLRRSEKNLQRMFEANPQPVVVLQTEDGWMLRTNAAAQALLALDGAGVRRIGEFFEDAADMERLLARAARHEAPATAECCIRDARGNRHWVLVAAVPAAYFDAEAMIVGFTDITGRRADEERLRQLSQAVEHAPASVIITDRRARIAYSNPMFTQVTGYRPDEVLGKNPSILGSGLTPYQSYRQLWKTILAGEVWRGEFINRRKDGGLYWESAAIAPVRDEHGEITHFVAVKADITAQKDAEARLRQAKEQAERGMRARSEFLAMMSHEIRTPMNGIMGMIQLLQDTDLTPTQRDYVEVVRHSSAALVTLLNDILDFSKLEAGKLTLEDEQFAPHDLVTSVVALMAPRAEEKGLRLDMRIADDVPPHLRGDSSRLRQVLLNLVGNAIKFTVQGSVTITVSRRPGPQADTARLHIAVADTGIGVPEDARQRLFADYEQADSSVARRFGGTGLGLAICKRIVTLMGGAIGVDSQPGEGSTFWIEAALPVAAATPEAPADTGRPADHRRRALRILLAEDNVINQKVAVGLLSRAGHAVTVVPDGGAAVKAAADGGFDLVLMDMEMPELSGVEATRRIRALPGATGRVPIIAMTANAMEGDRERCAEAGMNGFVSKPIDAGALERALTEVAGEAGAPGTGAAPAAGASAAAEVIDAGRVAELRDALGEGYFETLLDDYLAFAVATQQELRIVNLDDLDTLRRLAHEVLGTASNFGLAAVAAAAEAADAAFRGRDRGAIAEHVMALIQRLEETEQRLRTLKAAQPAD